MRASERIDAKLSVAKFWNSSTYSVKSRRSLLRHVPARLGRLRARGDEKRAQEMRGLGAEIAFRQIDDEHFALVHHVRDFERRGILAEDRSDERVGEECADLVLDRRDRLVAESGVVGGVFGLPKGAHDRVLAADDQPIAIVVVDQQAGKPEQGLIARVEQQAQRMAEDVFEALRPSVCAQMFLNAETMFAAAVARSASGTPDRGL